jgi:hypothetical protein
LTSIRVRKRELGWQPQRDLGANLHAFWRGALNEWRVAYNPNMNDMPLAGGHHDEYTQRGVPDSCV